MRHGSLFTGYGGLDIAAGAVFPGSSVAWVSDISDTAGKIITHRYPGVPNLGDITAVDWTAVEPVEVLTAGYPCQPFSKGGRRKGTDDVRHLWPYVRDAIRHLRPRFTLLENVSAHRSMGFDRVCGDVAEDGLRVRWASVRASDVGAPHERERVFLVVTDPDRESERFESRGARRPASIERRQGSTHDRPVGDGVEVPGGGPTAPDFDRWGEYAPAIARWERVVGRPAPDTVLDDDERINPAIPEWMMGLDEGWVTQVPGLSHSAMHQALGNGVVPQQAAYAVRMIAPETRRAW